MKVKGVEITEDQIAACIERMKRNSTFRAWQIVIAAIDAGVTPTGTVADRVADRLIQRERKAGNIGLRGGNQWSWLNKSIVR